MAEDAAPASPPAAAAPAPWHQGVEIDTIGFWQNKGYNLEDPKALTTELTKQYRELERFHGAPPDQLLKMPKPNAPETEVKGFWQRLGVPSDAKEYDFSGFKHYADGKEIEPGMLDALRQSFHRNFVPKDKANELVADIVKWIDGQDVLERTQRKQRVEQSAAEVNRAWGVNAEFNKNVAGMGARWGGLEPEDVQAMEDTLGYPKTMELLRRVGMAIREPDFVDRGVGTNGMPMTTAGAVSQLNELMKDQGFVNRLMSGDTEARQRFDNLNKEKARHLLGYDPSMTV